MHSYQSPITRDVTTVEIWPFALGLSYRLRAWNTRGGFDCLVQLYFRTGKRVSIELLEPLLRRYFATLGRRGGADSGKVGIGTGKDKRNMA